MLTPRRLLTGLGALACLVLLAQLGGSAVLPDDRADLFYSTYRGGGMDITGKSILVRKKFGEDFAVEGNYFIDSVSGASIDVLSNASVIKDERKQKSLSLEYIHDKTTYNASYSASDERDYISNTAHVGLSQDMFGDLTTLSLGFTDSRNRIGENNGTANAPDVTWLGHAQSRTYSAGLSQILTKNWISALQLDVVTDQGLLSNPYREIRFLDQDNPLGWSLAPQIYPNTHTSTAVEGRTKYYLPWRGAADFSYRYFRDTWGVRSNTFEVGYTHPFGDWLILEASFRHYQQNSASFYRDLFTFNGELNFEARDQNLASQHNNTFDIKGTWAYAPKGFWIFKRATVTGDYSFMKIDYSDFRNIKDYNNTPAGGDYLPGTEPLYGFSANIIQVYLSFYF